MSPGRAGHVSSLLGMDDLKSVVESLQLTTENLSRINDLVHDLVARFNELEARVQALEDDGQPGDDGPAHP